MNLLFAIFYIMYELANNIYLDIFYKDIIDKIIKKYLL